MSALVIVSSPNTALKWLSKSSAVKMPNCFDFFLYLRFMAFKNFLGCFSAILHMFCPSLVLKFRFAVRFIRLNFVRADTKVCLFTVFLFLKNVFLALLNSLTL